jgi:hypothetical protein
MNGNGIEEIKRLKCDVGFQPVRRLETRCVPCLQVSTNNMPLPLSVIRVFLLTMTVTASPLGRLQLCGSELANKLAEICSVQGYNDPFRNSMYYGECKSPTMSGVQPLTSRGIPEKSHFPKAGDHMGHPRGCHKTVLFSFKILPFPIYRDISGGQTLSFHRRLWVQSLIDFL